ncbi:TPR domain-containing protein [Colletotrichum musicola]|uniref:TPR domain-containing protein n=1 Tax=Colletotrichum musicola TaxID=2175873 RepID=A0A8H6J0R9_9PEZI|nr:TPR domain-containing protein [Colletotrichum musicola]
MGDFDHQVISAQEVEEHDNDDWETQSAKLDQCIYAYQSTNAMADLQDAIQAAEALDVLAQQDLLQAHRLEVLDTLYAMTRQKHSKTRSMTDLDVVIRFAEQAIQETPDTDPSKADRIGRLGQALIFKSNHTARLSDLNEAICVLRQGMEVISENNYSCRAAFLSDLGSSLSHRHDLAGNLDDLEDATRFAREALDLTDEHDPQLRGRLTNLGNRIWSRYQLSRSLQDLEESISLGRRAIHVPPMNVLHGFSDRLNNYAIRVGERYAREGDQEDIEKALGVCRQSIGVSEEGSSEWADRQHTLGSLLQHRYSRTRNTNYLDEAIAAEAKAVEAAPEDELTKARYLNTLGSRHGERYPLTTAKSDLDNAIRFTKKALETIPPNAEDNARILNNLATYLGYRHLETQSIADLDEAIDFAKRAVEATPAHRMGHRDGYGIVITAHRLVDQKYSRTQSASDLEDAILVTRGAVNVIPTHDVDHALLLEKLGNYHDDRYYTTETTEDLEAAVHFMERSLVSTPPGHPSWASRCNNVGLRLGSRYSRTGNVEDLKRAIDTSRKALEATPDGNLNRPDYLNNLGLNLGYEYARTGSREVLSEAVQLARQAVEYVPKDHPNRLYFLTNLGNRMGDHFAQTGDISDLEEATRLAREVLEATDANGPRVAVRMNNLGERLRQTYLRTGNVDYLNQAINLARQGIANNLFAMDHPERLEHSINLALRLADRYLLTGSEDDLKEAIDLANEAVQLTNEGHPDRALRLSALGSLMGTKYSRTRHLGDLDEAIAYGRKAADADAAGNLGKRAEYLNNLSNRLSDRNAHTGALEDLNEAVKTAQEAVDAITPGHPDRAMYMNNLALHLDGKHRRTKKAEDLDQALLVARGALKLLPSADHPERAPILSTIGILLMTRFEDERRQFGGSMGDLDEALRCVEEAALVTPKGRPDRVKYLNNVGNYAGVRYQRLHRREDLDKATAALKEAIKASPENHPDRTAPMSNLARLLRERGETEDLEEAKRLFKAVLNFDQAPIRVRINAGRLFLATADVVKDSREAYEVARKTISMISIFAPVSLRPADKQYLLSQAVGLASDAAAIALHARKGNPAEALELLETGRGIIAGSLQKMRADLSELHRSCPDLANSFEELREILDRPSLPGNGRVLPDMTDSGPASVEADIRHLASARMDAVLSEIHRQPGFENFLGAATEAQMLQSAALGPVVVLNVSTYNCVAIVVEHSGIRVLDLQKVTYSEIESKARYIRSPDCLDWLWEVIVRPVLDFLGFRKTPSEGEPWPHLWWILTGPLVGFPLHAAGHHFGNKGESALDRVVSSYASSIQTLINARQQQQHTIFRPKAITQGGDEGGTDENDEKEQYRPNGDVVLVSMSETPGKSSLEHAGNEIIAVKQVCNAMGLPYTQPASRQEDVLAALNHSCGVFHFAGHGATHMRDPMESQLLLEDWDERPLTVGSLLETNLVAKSPFLAYLSACGTSQILDNRVVDESIHLACAFQLAGFRHVIGTLWEVDDALCVHAAKMTYQALWDGGMTDASVSEGLHHTMRRLRDGWVRSNGFHVGRHAGSIEADTKRAVLDGQQASEEESMRATRTIAKSESTTPLWVPYVHFGP